MKIHQFLIHHRLVTIAVLSAATISLASTVSQPVEAATSRGSLSVAIRVSPSVTNVNFGDTFLATVRFTDHSVGCSVKFNQITLDSTPLPLLQVGVPSLDNTQSRIVEAHFPLFAVSPGATMLRATISAEHNCAGTTEAILFEADSATIKIALPAPVRPIGVGGPLAPDLVLGGKDDVAMATSTSAPTVTSIPPTPTNTPIPGNIIRIIRAP